MLGSTDGGATWTPQASNSVQALTGIACVDDLDCFAGGAIGTVVATHDGGVTWAQQGNPISGPVTAPNAGPTGITAIFAAACNSTRCLMGTASSGNIMTTPLLTVTVNTSSEYLTTPNLSGLVAERPGDHVQPGGQAGNVTGTLTCSTTADNTSHVAVYPISACSGLADAGFNVVYDYADSGHSVVPAAQTISFTAPDRRDVRRRGLRRLGDGVVRAHRLVQRDRHLHADRYDGAHHRSGDCVVTASQAGSTDYQPAPDVVQTITIAKEDQTIAFGALGDTTFGSADFGIDATASSGLTVSLAVTSGPCTLDSATSPANVHIAGAGSCTITASQAGDDNFNPAADVPRSFTIAMANQTIAFGPLSGMTYGDPDRTLTATASSGLTVSFTASGDCTVSGVTLHVTGAGTCSVTASQPGDSNYNPAPDVSQSFAIAKANQTITFGPINSHTFGDADFTVAATASSGLAVTFAATGNCTISGATVHITASGSCTVVASQAGNGDYNAAANVSQTFAIVNTAAGTVTGFFLEPATGGQAELLVTASSRGLTGTLVYEPKQDRFHRPVRPFQSNQITSFGIASDGNSAWIAGVSRDGHSFLLYVEDNSRRSFRTQDVFRLWIDGVLQTGTGALRHGDIRIVLPPPPRPPHGRP